MNSILITGAGSGIGAAVAQRLSQRKGIRVLLLGRRLEALEQVRATMQTPDAHVVFSVDVSDSQALVVALESEKAGLDNHPLTGVFANAGIGGGNQWGEDDRWEDIIRVNLTGTYNTLMVSRRFLDRSKGVKQVLVTSSVLARFGVPGQSAYVTSKTGLLGLVRSLAVEWSPQGIMVNALCPGWVDTDMARNSIQSMADAQGMSFEECKVQQEAILPSLRMTTPAEMAQWVDFVFSGLGEGEDGPRLATFTGQALDVNSGSWMG
tara:strand:+ start:323 stop:1114 length:792 start_codon:yes stop_codon:yes gene_type:complete